MALLVFTSEVCSEHETGLSHPERPERTSAVLDGIGSSLVREAVALAEAPSADMTDLGRVHDVGHLRALEQLCAEGGGAVDPDTWLSEGSWRAALRAAGAGLAAVEELRAGAGDAAFCVVRPPGHHAERRSAMGFCLVNNVAVTAAKLADEGERVLIADYDAHHGNGTQAIFWEDPRVMYVSWHQWPLYPGTGAAEEIGGGTGSGTTVNFPLPPLTTGDTYLRSVDEVLAPLVERFAPTWLLISAGFDAHRDDPITSMGLTSGDYAQITAKLVEFVSTGRVVAFLEGGYDLGALRSCAAGVAAALLGETEHPEPPTSGGPGGSVITYVKRLFDVWFR
ncbi:MAG: histone deacetylase [Acidimicrobiales bacterium]|nr:MAG: histone deacetylase [Acidimicrobiales bacterium]